MIKLYTKNNCIQCKMTKQLLYKLGVEYDEVNINDNPEVIEPLKKLGVRQMPVGMIDDEIVFKGFEAGKIKELGKQG